MKHLVLAAAAAFCCLNARAYDPKEVVVTGHDLPAELVDVGVEEHLGAKLDLTLEFTDDKGVTAPLGTFVNGKRPVLMAMVYYNCPSLCNYHLNGLTDAMKALTTWTAGEQFDVVAISMDSSETAELAGKKKANYLKLYGKPETDGAWHFLVGSKANVGKIASELGFKFKWLEDKQQFAHASVTYVITPTGRISRYLHGIQPDPQTLKLSLLDAGQGTIGSMVEQVLMFCFQFNPTKNKYTIYSWNIMRIGAILMLLLLAVVLIPLWWREKRKSTSPDIEGDCQLCRRPPHFPVTSVRSRRPKRRACGIRCTDSCWSSA